MKSDPLIVENVVKRFTPLLKRLASKWAYKTMGKLNPDDLYQIGVLSLLESDCLFKDYDDTQLSVYISQRVQGAFIDSQRLEDPLSRSLRNFKTHDTKLRDQLKIYEPCNTDSKIAKSLGLSLEKYNKQRMLASDAVVSFEELLVSEGIDELQDSSYDPFKLLEKARLSKSILHAYRQLDKTQQMILNMYYCHGLTLVVIGKRFKVSESRASQLLAGATRDLKEFLRG